MPRGDKKEMDKNKAAWCRGAALELLADAIRGVKRLQTSQTNSRERTKEIDAAIEEAEMFLMWATEFDNGEDRTEDFNWFLLDAGYGDAEKWDWSQKWIRKKKEAAAEVVQTSVSTGDSCTESTTEGACTRPSDAPVAEKPDRTGGSGGGESPPQRSSLLQRLIVQVKNGPKS